MSWKIFYADGSTFSSEDGEPDAAPDGVQAIAEHRGSRTLLHTGGEFYRWIEGEGWKARAKMDWPMINVKKSGLLMADADFILLRGEAMNWLDPVF